MALKQHKKAITRIFILMVVMTLLCVGVFSCTTYMEQERKTFVDMSQVELVQLETPLPARSWQSCSQSRRRLM